ncbi:unnamed protein product [Hapterophycus canaliculatus]
MGESIDRERLVLSEVHVGSGALDEDAEVVSRYTYLTPRPSFRHSSTNVDASSESSESEGEKGEGGDDSANVPRRRKRPRHTEAQRYSRPAHEVLTVVHRTATTLGLVGQQVWSAAFLLGDFVLTHEEFFAGKQVLELGAGPGVAGLIAARVARKCFLTDYHQEVLELLARNVEANRHLFALDFATTARNGEVTTRAEGNAAGHGDSSPEHGDVTSEHCAATVRELDWFTFSTEDGPTDSAICDTVAKGSQGVDTQVKGDGAAMTISDKRGKSHNFDSPFTWNKGELEGLSAPTQTAGGGLVIIAADVIYDEGLTDALFDALKSLMPAPRPFGEHTPHGRDRKLSSGEKNEAPAGQTPPVTTAEDSVDEVHPAVSFIPFRRRPIEDALADRSCLVRGDGEAVLFLALEKRFNFSLAELSVAATGYSALIRNVLDVTGGDGAGVKVAERCPRQSPRERAFEGRRLPLSFQQCFRYQRSNAMELWEIRRRPVNCNT